MRLLLTGLNGTLAPSVAEAAMAHGWQVLAWDRQAVPVHDTHWLQQARPDAIAHLAMGDEHWAGRLAAFAAAQGLPMLFTSTAMVFDAEPDGPHQPHDARTARDDYGRSKIRCEDAVLAAHRGATVLRIGWQIHPTRPGNNMLAQLDGWQQQQGEVAASRVWRPACSFMDDTAQAIVALLAQPVAGPVHLDSNADEGHGFDALVAALQRHFHRPQWRLRVHDDYRHDQRLAGGGARVPPLSVRLRF
ncbi:MAG: sugar nucleotide-binding protein [Rubrivivax sp.]|nr:sugar nucleotide-binding protein [Rubrivivax sp.]